jgi:ATPase subunit of ABC transporter with duplicated ATPase domains
MLQIKNLNVIHKKDNRTLIENFSFTLHEGEKAAIIGEEGNGKSTLLKLIYGEELVEEYVEYTGEIIKNGHKIGYLPQELEEKDKEKTVYEYCSERPMFYCVTPKEQAMIARKLSISPELFYSDQLLKTLSGGERIKIQIACLLMESADLFFFDEPSNDIDMETLIWLEEFLKETKTPVLYISHDEILLEHTANTIIHMEQIKRKTVSKITVARCGYAEYVESRGLLLDKQEQIARKERSEYRKQQEKFQRIAQKVNHQQNTISRQDPHGGQLLKKKMHAVKAQEKRFQKNFENMTEIPDTEDAILLKFKPEIRIPNGKILLDYKKEALCMEDQVLAKNLELRVMGAEKICIIGKNGVGKSTMLKEIAGQLLARKDIKAYYMPQNYEEELPLLETPVEFLTQTGEKAEQVRIRTFLGSMKYTADEMQHAILHLSGGQKAKLLFVKMVLCGCNVLILDEPTRNFSPLSAPVIRQILKEFGGAVISVSHDRKYMQEVCSKIYRLTENGLILL